MKKTLSIVLVIMLLSTSMFAFADGRRSSGFSIFKDLDKENWAYGAIKTMVENNVFSE